MKSRSWTTTREAKAKDYTEPIHPGEILREEFMNNFGLNANKLALGLRVPAPRIYDIVNEKREITPETALRLARYFNTSPEFWMNLQTRYSLQVAKKKNLRQVEQDVRPLQAEASR